MATAPSALYHHREARRGRHDPSGALYITARFDSGDNPIDTDAAFPDRGLPITVAMVVKRTAAGSNGLLFDFGGTTTGFAAYLDGADLGFAAGAAVGTDGGLITVSSALPATSQNFRLVFTVVPGFGVMRVWIDGLIKGALETASMSAWAGTGDGAIGDAGAGGTTARVPAPQAVTLANAAVVGPARFYYSQRPRQLDFNRAKTVTVPKTTLQLTTFAPSAVVA